MKKLFVAFLFVFVAVTDNANAETQNKYSLFTDSTLGLVLVNAYCIPEGRPVYSFHQFQRVIAREIGVSLEEQYRLKPVVMRELNQAIKEFTNMPVYAKQEFCKKSMGHFDHMGIKLVRE